MTRQKHLFCMFLMLVMLLIGCNSDNTDVIVENIADSATILGFGEILERAPGLWVEQTEYGSYAHMGYSDEYPERLERVALTFERHKIALVLPKDMGDSYFYDDESNSLILYNEDKSKIVFLYVSEFLQDAEMKKIYDKELLNVVLGFDGFCLEDDDSVIVECGDEKIVQYISATTEESIAAKALDNMYSGVVMRYQMYDEEPILNENGEIKSYTGLKYCFFYGVTENTDSEISEEHMAYIAENFNVEEGWREIINIADKDELQENYQSNVIFENREYVVETSFLNSCRVISEEAAWENYMNLDLYRTYISEDMAVEEIQDEILKSHVFIDTYAFPFNPSGNRGSGFIIDMDEDTLYIATNEHVAHLPDGEKNGYHIRFDNDIEGANDIMYNYSLKGTLIGATYSPDYAVIEVDISEVPYCERYAFKAIPQIEELSVESGMVVYMYRMKKDCEAQLKEGTIKTEELYRWSDGSICYQVTELCISGDSGSLVFNDKGQCIGMMLGTHYYDSSPTDVIITYSWVLETFEEIVGRPLYQ